MANIKVKDLTSTTSVSSTDKIMLLTDDVNNVVKNITIEDFSQDIVSSDFVNDLISSDANNGITQGTDDKLYVDNSDSGVVAGTYQFPQNLVVDSKGKITSITNGSTAQNNFTPFSINSCNTTNGYADVLYAPGSGTAYANTPVFNDQTEATNGIDGVKMLTPAYYGITRTSSTVFFNAGAVAIFDLGASYSLNSINTTGYWVSGQNNGCFLKIEGSTDNSSWTTIISSLACGGNSGVATNKTTALSGTYRYIKLTSVGPSGYNEWLWNVSFNYTVSVSTADTLYFNVGGTYPNLVATTANGTTFERNAISPIDISGYADGTYNGFVKDDSIEFLANTLSYQAKTPTSPSSGDVWYDTATEPYNAYKYDGADWQEYDGVPIGKITVASGVITKVVQPNVCGATRLVDIYHNGTSWYRKYSDGWCVQGGMITAINTSSGAEHSVILLVPFIDTNYSLFRNASLTTNASGTYTGYYLGYKTKTTTGFSYLAEANSYVSDYTWVACGYVN